MTLLPLLMSGCLLLHPLQDVAAQQESLWIQRLVADLADRESREQLSLLGRKALPAILDRVREADGDDLLGLVYSLHAMPEGGAEIQKAYREILAKRPPVDRVRDRILEYLIETESWPKEMDRIWTAPVATRDAVAQAVQDWLLRPERKDEVLRYLDGHGHKGQRFLLQMLCGHRHRDPELLRRLRVALGDPEHAVTAMRATSMVKGAVAEFGEIWLEWLRGDDSSRLLAVFQAILYVPATGRSAFLRRAARLEAREEVRGRLGLLFVLSSRKSWWVDPAAIDRVLSQMPAPLLQLCLQRLRGARRNQLPAPPLPTSALRKALRSKSPAQVYATLNLICEWWASPLPEELIPWFHARFPIGQQGLLGEDEATVLSVILHALPSLRDLQPGFLDPELAPPRSSGPRIRSPHAGFTYASTRLRLQLWYDPRMPLLRYRNPISLRLTLFRSHRKSQVLENLLQDPKWNTLLQRYLNRRLGTNMYPWAMVLRDLPQRFRPPAREIIKAAERSLHQHREILATLISLSRIPEELRNWAKEESHRKSPDPSLKILRVGLRLALGEDGSVVLPMVQQVLSDGDPAKMEAMLQALARRLPGMDSEKRGSVARWLRQQTRVTDRRMRFIAFTNPPPIFLAWSRCYPDLRLALKTLRSSGMPDPQWKHVAQRLLAAWLMDKPERLEGFLTKASSAERELCYQAIMNGQAFDPDWVTILTRRILANPKDYRIRRALMAMPIQNPVPGLRALVANDRLPFVARNDLALRLLQVDTKAPSFFLGLVGSDAQGDRMVGLVGLSQFNSPAAGVHARLLELPRSRFRNGDAEEHPEALAWRLALQVHAKRYTSLNEKDLKEGTRLRRGRGRNLTWQDLRAEEVRTCERFEAMVAGPNGGSDGKPIDWGPAYVPARSWNPAHRAMFLRMLQRSQRPYEPVRPLVEEALLDRDPRVRQHTLRVLIYFGQRAKTSLPALQSWPFQQEEPELFQKALQALR